MATFTNKATLSYNGGSTDSNIVTGTLLETLSASKTALVNSYEQGSEITYVVNLVSSGAGTFSNLNLSDNLGAYSYNGTMLYPLSYIDGAILYYVNGVLQPSPEVVAGPMLSISGISVPAGGASTIIYSVVVNEFAPIEAQESITNTVTITGSGLAEPITASETINTVDSPNLSITKALSPVAVPENGEITYTFVIQNSGNTDAVATDNLVVSDIFDPILNISSVTLNGAPLVLNTDYTYNDQTGEFATTPSTITVPRATYTRADDGSFVVVPSTATLVVVGLI